VRGLIGVVLIVLLGASCSAKEPAECEWRIQSDEAYNAAMTAIDSARAHSRHAADNYQFPYEIRTLSGHVDYFRNNSTLPETKSSSP
jgi:hypothetical protein